MFRFLTTIVASLILLIWHTPVSADVDLREAIRAETELMLETGHVSVDDIHIAAVDLIAKVYELRGFAPGWQEQEKAESVLKAIRAAYDDGLSPHDYHLTRIGQLWQSPGMTRELTMSDRALFDLMLTDSLIRLMYHQTLGKVNLEMPDPTWAFGRPVNGRDPSTVIDDLIDSAAVAEAISTIAARGPHYQRLRAQLKRHRGIAGSGGWPAVPEGPTIRPGSEDPRLDTLAKRLAVSGDLSEIDASRSTAAYDEVLQDAVRRFQIRHGLEADALVGRATLRALNVSIEQRIDQIRLNLDRYRRLADSQSAYFILVNIAGYKAYVVRDGEFVWTSKVIVGTIEDKTPIFSSTLKYIVFNPTWTIPHSIASEEMLPKIRQDPGFLDRGYYQLLDQAGNLIEPSSVDWSTINVRNFRFTIVQQPNPLNQLGQIKFIFPNEYSVYVHDTSEVSLFARAKRAFSHGCIRVDNPCDLAEILLAGEGWTRERIDSQIESEEIKTVVLSKPLPVLIRYWTAEVDDQGMMYFYDDIYGRDAVALESLERPFRGDHP